MTGVTEPPQDQPNNQPPSYEPPAFETPSYEQPPAYQPPPPTAPPPAPQYSPSGYALQSDPQATPQYGTPPPFQAPAYQGASAYQPSPASYGLPPGTYLDPASGVVLPNGVTLASKGRRIGGFVLEILLFIVTLAIGYLIWMLIAWARGQTPGKQVLHMRCYRPESRSDAGWWYMFLRQFVGAVINQITFGVVFLVSVIMLIARKDNRTIPDLIAGTVVIKV